MSDYEKSSQEFAARVTAKEGETAEQSRAQVDFPYRLSDWSQPKPIKVCRDGEPLRPLFGTVELLGDGAAAKSRVRWQCRPVSTSCARHSDVPAVHHPSKTPGRGCSVPHSV